LDGGRQSAFSFRDLGKRYERCASDLRAARVKSCAHFRSLSLSAKIHENLDLCVRIRCLRCLSALRQGAQAPGSYLPPAPPVSLETSESGSTGRTCLTSALRLWQPRLCLLLLPSAFSVRYSYNANHPHAIFQPERIFPHASPLCPIQTYQHCTASTRKVSTLSAAVS